MAAPTDAEFEAWIQTLSEEDQVRVATMRTVLDELGAGKDTGLIVQRDMTSRYPNYARFSLLHAVWQYIEDWRDTPSIARMADRGRTARNEPFSDADAAVARMIDAGASLEDIATFARYVAYGQSFSVMYTLDEGCHPRRSDDIGWALIETGGPLARGRHMDSLHEDVLGADPTGREGRPA